MRTVAEERRICFDFVSGSSASEIAERLFITRAEVERVIRKMVVRLLEIQSRYERDADRPDDDRRAPAAD